MATRVTIYIRSGDVKLILKQNRRRPEWLAEQLSTSTWYTYKLINGLKPVSVEMSEKIINVMRHFHLACRWDRLFRSEVTESGGNRGQ